MCVCVCVNVCVCVCVCVSVCVYVSVCGVKKGRNKRQDYRGKQEPGHEYLKQSLTLYRSNGKVLKGLKLSTMIRGLPWWLRG